MAKHQFTNRVALSSGIRHLPFNLTKGFLNTGQILNGQPRYSPSAKNSLSSPRLKDSEESNFSGILVTLATSNKSSPSNRPQISLLRLPQLFSSITNRRNSPKSSPSSIFSPCIILSSAHAIVSF